MCLVPSFLDLLERDQGVLDVVAIATQNPHIKDALQDLLWNVTDFDEVSPPPDTQPEPPPLVRLALLQSLNPNPLPW